MDLITESMQGLTAAEKLWLVERIWDDLAAQEEPFPLPDWAVREAARRRDEMIANPHLGMTSGEMWARIASSRNGSSRNVEDDSVPPFRGGCDRCDGLVRRKERNDWVRVRR